MCPEVLLKKHIHASISLFSSDLIHYQRVCPEVLLMKHIHASISLLSSVLIHYHKVLEMWKVILSVRVGEYMKTNLRKKMK